MFLRLAELVEGIENRELREFFKALPTATICLGFWIVIVNLIIPSLKP